MSKVPVAQWIARWTSNPKVPGSNPGRDAKYFLTIFNFHLLRIVAIFSCSLSSVHFSQIQFLTLLQYAEIPSKCSHERNFLTASSEAVAVLQVAVIVAILSI